MESALYAAALRFRRDIIGYEEAASSRMVTAYATSWRQIRSDLEPLQREIQRARDAGQKVDEGWLYREDRLQRLQRQAEDQIRSFVPHANDAIRTAQSEAVLAAVSHAEALTGIAFAGVPSEVGIGINFARLNTGATESLVGFASNGSPLRALLDQLPGSAGASVENRLIAAVATSQNPKVTARLLREDLGGDLDRARRIARTETFRAYREASRQAYGANSELYDGWIWVASLSDRTCIACLAMHGTLHPFSETLDGHVCCRCVMVPHRKSLAELGFPGIADRRPEFQTGPEWFGKQSAERQERILGSPRALAAYQAGDVTLNDFVGVHRSDEWGTQRYERSLKGALAAAGSN